MFRSRSSSSSSSLKKKKSSKDNKPETAASTKTKQSTDPEETELGIEIRAEDIIYEETRTYDEDVSSNSSCGSGSANTATSSGYYVVARRLPDGSVVVPLDIEHLSLAEERWEVEQRASFVAAVKERAKELAAAEAGEAGSTSHCLKSRYGKPRPAREVADIMSPPPGFEDDGGLIYHARLVPDDPEVQAKLRRRKILVKRRDVDQDGNIRPRRGPYPIALVSDFMRSLVRIDDGDHPRWVFSGVLNGWPGLTCLEVRSITCRTTDKISTLFDRDRTNLLKKQMLRNRLVRLWSADKQGAQGIPPHVHSEVTSKAMEIRVTLRAPPYSARGWTKRSVGYVFWFEGQRANRPRLLHGEDIIRTVVREAAAVPAAAAPVCVAAHKFSHRYAVGERGEQAKDKVTYHSAVLLEWDHGRYCTVVELALLNGLGGYAGKCNWYDDKNDDLPAVYLAMPPCMIAPWETGYAEIRCFDVAARNLDEFKAFVDRYTGQKLRFLDPHFTHSFPVRLTLRSKDHIARYLLNYIGRDRLYSELNRNCQTFAADFYGFLVGKKGIEPFHPINRVDYTNRAYHFLYDYTMYDGGGGGGGSSGVNDDRGQD